MSFFDRPLRQGSPFMLFLGAAITVFFAAYAAFDAEDRYFSLLFVVLGLVLTWRQYVIFSRKKK